MSVKNYIEIYGDRYDLADGVNLASSKEESNTAAYVHGVGERFLYMGELYEATRAIAVGGTITPNINCTRIYLGDELTQLKSETGLLDNDVKTLQLFTGVGMHLNLTERDIYKNVYVPFPVTAGETYVITNDAGSQYIAVFTTDTQDASHDIETVAAGLNANRQAIFTATQDAAYLRIWCNDLPVIADIENAKNLKKSIDYVKQENWLAVARSINLLDTRAVTNGYYIASSGALYDNALYCVTDFIPISEGQTLHTTTPSSSSQYYALYDANFNYIANSAVASTTQAITGTAASKYARFTFNIAELPGAMVYSGDEPNKFLPYNPSSGYGGYEITPTAHYINNDALRLSKMTKVSTTFTNNYIFEDAVNNAVTSDYIEVDVIAEQYYFVMINGFSASYDVLRFYDKDKNVIGKIAGGQPDDGRYGIPLKLAFPNSCQYIRFAQYANGVNNSGAGIYMGYFTSFEKSVAEIVSNYNTDNNNVLWLGTSIPEGATYPAVACAANGYNCINKAVGSSKLCFEGEYISGADNTKGRRLTATVDELEALYRDDVTNNVITEATLTAWKNGSYENSVIPYIDGTNETQVSMIVIDHGFNDRSTIYYQIQDKENIDWDSDDRSTFSGAFKYLVDKIQAVNPFVKIVIGGYFTNTVSRLSFSYNGPEICEMQELLAKRYNFSLLKVWEHSQISPLYVAGTDDYLTDFNAEYGTSYTAITPDADGNITALQLYCPDGMHPHSDLTGNCNKRLNAVYTKLLAHMI